MDAPRRRVLEIINRRGDGAAFWTGHPSDAIVPILSGAWGIAPTREAIYSYLEDDCRWIGAWGGLKDPDQALDPYRGIESHIGHAAGGVLRGAETLADVESMYAWPKRQDYDYSHIYAEIDKHPDKAVFTGDWSPFFHIVAAFFGMERYFVLMHENPKIVEAVTERVADCCVASNEALFSGLGDRADIMFFGNDFGTQQDLFISPDCFRRFALPTIKRLVSVGKKHGKKVAMHCCGSIYRIIPMLIDAGVDLLHPIQAQAAGMSAAELAKYKGDIAFLGGIDAQSFFVNASPSQIADEVARVYDILGPNIIISPSHEAILPNVPPENVLAMARAAKGLARPAKANDTASEE
ncbi:MAG: methyltransferase [Defluviitaleaceae bacterium]|nr:methyltransferase [Defluviitaleaceae bacterium]